MLLRSVADAKRGGGAWDPLEEQIALDLCVFYYLLKLLPAPNIARGWGPHCSTQAFDNY